MTDTTVSPENWIGIKCGLYDTLESDVLLSRINNGVSNFHMQYYLSFIKKIKAVYLL